MNHSDSQVLDDEPVKDVLDLGRRNEEVLDFHHYLNFPVKPWNAYALNMKLILMTSKTSVS